MSGSITDVDGIAVGHATDLKGITGCTVILCQKPMRGGVDVRGSASGTRELEMLRSFHLVDEVHAILLTGGSAFGLAAADGVMQFLSSAWKGFDVGIPGRRVPLVPAAVLFDLMVGNPEAYPTPEMGLMACEGAVCQDIERGCVGVGTGATVGKLFGIERATKGGIGTASLALPEGVVVGALAAVNPFGDVVDPSSGRILAGARGADGKGFVRTLEAIKGLRGELKFGHDPRNTVLGVVATNATLTGEGIRKVAQMAHDGLARAVAPAHTMLDGDTIFSLCSREGEPDADITVIGAAAAEAMTLAILDAVEQATSLGGIPAMRDL